VSDFVPSGQRLLTPVQRIPRQITSFAASSPTTASLILGNLHAVGEFNEVLCVTS
jgi:hypothetical protein